MAQAPPGVHWAFVRDSQNIPVSFAQVKKDGGGLLFNADDPNFTAKYNAARQAGIPVGVWIPAGSKASLEGGDATTYANRIQDINSKYKPDIVVPDLESRVEGVKGQPGWAWNDSVTSQLKGKGIPLGVTIEPNKGSVFNTKAWTDLGATVMPQAYGATYSDLKDPAAVRQNLIANGVPASMIDVILAPNQKGDGGATGSYAIDDMQPGQVDANFASPGASPSAPQVPGQGQAAPGQDGVSILKQLASQLHGGPVNSPNIPDSQNPVAQAYSRAQLAKYGIHVPQGHDAAAMWRQFSAQRAQHAAMVSQGLSNDQTDAQTVQQTPQPLSISPAVHQLLHPGGVPNTIAHPVITKPAFQPQDPAAALLNQLHPVLAQQSNIAAKLGPFQQALQTAAAIRQIQALNSSGSAPARAFTGS